jgi:hypothetical protein
MLRGCRTCVALVEPMLHGCHTCVRLIIIINHASAGQLNCFAQLNALLVLHDRGVFAPMPHECDTCVTLVEPMLRWCHTCVRLIIINHASAGQLNCFAQLNALLVLHDRGIFAPMPHECDTCVTLVEPMLRGCHTCVTRFAPMLRGCDTLCNTCVTLPSAVQARRQNHTGGAGSSAIASVGAAAAGAPTMGGRGGACRPNKRAGATARRQAAGGEAWAGGDEDAPNIDRLGGRISQPGDVRISKHATLVRRASRLQRLHV